MMPLDGYLTNDIFTGNDILGQALITLEGDLSASNDTAQDNSIQNIATDNFNSYLNGQSSLTNSPPSSEGSTAPLYSNIASGAQETCNYFLISTDQTLNYQSSASVTSAQTVSPEDCCQTLNALDTTMTPRKRRNPSSDSNDSDSSTTKKSKTTLWRDKQKTEMNEKESEIMNKKKAIEKEKYETHEKSIYLAGLQKKPKASEPSYATFFENYHYLKIVEKEVHEKESYLEAMVYGNKSKKIQQLGGYIKEQKDILKLMEKLLTQRKSLNEAMDQQIQKWIIPC